MLEVSDSIAALVGVLTGAAGVAAFRISERLQNPPAPPAPSAGALPAGVSEVLTALRSSAVVLSADDQVVKASAASYAAGVVSGTELTDAELREMVRACRRDGRVREVETDLSSGLGRPPAVVLARVTPLGPHHVLLLLEDRTESRRIEAVRRDFVANVSHELKTPVGALSLLSEAVEEAADDPEAVRHFSRRMRREAVRLTALVQEIIDLSRLQAADHVVQPEVLEVDALVAEAVDRVGTLAQGRGSEVVVAGRRGLQVRGDRELLVTALRNLVHNALAYSPERSRVVVEVREGSGGVAGEAVGQQVPTVDIAVSDRGVGISAADLNRIFERFYRVDPARSRSTGGTGLGLSIVKHVAGNHGGEVLVWSAEGEGSTFTLRLPGLAATAEPRPAAEPGAGAGSGADDPASTSPPAGAAGRTTPHTVRRPSPRTSLEVRP
ncbi:two-component system sensor histidine kinase SenX3 [Kineococcus radiotolerans]|uniref:Sensor-like histidine kinase SenX3 n=1 Tax=Kineococcus radiotolerans TaxID=131568 RepID=A0A7W4TK76_KINRA|nr:ATP-binding protein [Kineococcus radiotolerans]MBB2900425.1 two-component system sensor histidine kinase SenX3 [Kineococcus radiotolerans]